MTVRTRLAPSPTGYMHIGTLRTALYNYFFARQKGGKFFLRIEDTDQARFVPGALESLLRTFHTLDISYDEGPVLLVDGTIDERGDKGPYVQSQRLHLYRQHAQQLLDAGHAYHCFCTKDRLDAMRAAQAAAKQTPKYDRQCLLLSADEVAARLVQGEAYVIRMKIPEGAVTVVDEIRGSVTFDLANIDDQVLMKADGFPTYHLAVVVDDHLMETTHVIRGEEWLSSTPKHILLYRMFGWQPPAFAHLPLLLNPDRSKLSKRQGDVAVEDYLAKGYLPAALVNFVATLGFNPKADKEIYSIDELVALFDLAKVNKSGAVMNMEKLDWMNHHYLMQLSEDDLAAAVAPFTPADLTHPPVRRALMVERERVNRLTEFDEKLAPYMAVAPYDASLLVWKKADAEDARCNIAGVREVLARLPADTFAQPSLLESAIKEYIVGNGLQNGNVLWPLRVALSGLEKSASPYEFLWALGKEESLARCSAALGKLG